MRNEKGMQDTSGCLTLYTVEREKIRWQASATLLRYRLRPQSRILLPLPERGHTLQSCIVELSTGIRLIHGFYEDIGRRVGIK